MALLEVKNLFVTFDTKDGEVTAVRDVSFSLERGKILGIVGESGSGKSVTVYSIMGILAGGGRIVSGSVKFRGKELVGLSEEEMRKIRGNKISLIFQDPMTSLNPFYTVGFQLREAIELHTDRRGGEAFARARELLALVGITAPEERLRQYPFELSGGMRQRIMIAMALASEPDILIADEPTTALDVTIQAGILKLIKELRDKLGMAVIMITHDLGVVSAICDEVTVMYAGKICEAGETRSVLENPRHEYTRALLRSLPTNKDKGGRLYSIKGSPPNLLYADNGCPFAPRCEEAMKICLSEYPDVSNISGSHYARCWFIQKTELFRAFGDKDRNGTKRKDS